MTLSARSDNRSPFRHRVAGVEAEIPHELPELAARPRVVRGVAEVAPDQLRRGVAEHGRARAVDDRAIPRRIDPECVSGKPL